MTDSEETRESHRPASIVETEVGTFEIVKNYRDAFETKAFIERYVKYFDQYPYIVGDISADKLRLKGFNSNNEQKIFDYLMESATPNAPFFVLKRVK